MGRTAGARNKSTIAREEAMKEFKRFLAIKKMLEENPEREEEQINAMIEERIEMINEKNKNIPILDEKAVEKKNIPESIPENVSEDISEDISKKVQGVIVEDGKEKNDAKVTEQGVEAPPKKRRGRPRKNPLPNEQSVETPKKAESEDKENVKENKKSKFSLSSETGIVNPQDETENTNATDNSVSNKIVETPTKKSKVKNNNPYCERCHSEITESPYSPPKIDVNMVTGTSEYTRSSPRYVILCHKCSEKLNQIVDDFLYDEGKGVPPKPYTSRGVAYEKAHMKE